MIYMNVLDDIHDHLKLLTEPLSKKWHRCYSIWIVVIDKIKLPQNTLASTSQNGQTHSNNSSANKPTNCLSVLAHFVGLVLKGLTHLASISSTWWKVSKYGVVSGPYFPVFGPEKTSYLDTFQTVILSIIL